MLFSFYLPVTCQHAAAEFNVNVYSSYGELILIIKPLLFLTLQSYQFQWY